MGYIYKITNNINNKCYIGLTTRDIETRWKEHQRAAFNKNHCDYNTIFKKAIRKYGSENFSIEIIDSSESLEELKEKEVFWIKQLNTFAFSENGYGYNSTRGGDYINEIYSIPVYQISIIDKRINKSYNSIKDAENDFPGVEDILYRGKGQNPKNSGFTWIRQKDYDSYIPEDHYNDYKIICQLDLNGNFIRYWFSTTDIANFFNKKTTNVTNCLCGLRQKAEGYQWCYIQDLSDRINKEYQEPKRKTKSVIQLDLNDNVIKKWNSIREAAQNLGLHESKISNVCHNKRKTTGGFKWKFIE